MKKYKVKVTPKAYEKLQKILDYLVRIKKNKQAARNVMRDYRDTKEILTDLAGSLREGDNEILQKKNLKRLNFIKHDYFLLYRVDGDKALVMNIFHGSEDYESKLS